MGGGPWGFSLVTQAPVVLQMHVQAGQGRESYKLQAHWRQPRAEQGLDKTKMTGADTQPPVSTWHPSFLPASIFPFTCWFFHCTRCYSHLSMRKLCPALGRGCLLWNCRLSLSDQLLCFPEDSGQGQQPPEANPGVPTLSPSACFPANMLRHMASSHQDYRRLLHGAGAVSDGSPRPSSHPAGAEQMFVDRCMGVWVDLEPNPEAQCEPPA